ncbi:MAG: RagB/SusD family nutrient uptake outer membrane protein [Fimbriimonadaceae bacterium]|nr:RagB/SusD family nutrient uptake outer membrane protein [Chitinophagales bacterium]
MKVIYNIFKHSPFTTHYSLIFILLLTIFTSCEDILDLEPAQSISNEIALGDDESVKQALAGAYDYLSVSSLFGGEIMRNAELYAGEGEILWVGTFTAPKEIFQRNILSTNTDVSGLWNNAYIVINACNAILGALDVVNEDDRNQVEGEAKFLRGLCYFELTRSFGQQYETGGGNTQAGVPMVLTATTGFDESSFVTRNTVEEGYAQAIADLTSAESLMEDENDFYANSSVAAAILARVYLQMGDYANAGNAADRVINSGNYELLANIAECFGQEENTDEDVFAIQISEQDGTNAMNLYFAPTIYGGRGDIEIEAAHLALYDPSDIRLTLFEEIGGSTYTSKFNTEFGNLPVIRLAEMYLIRAECNERLGTSVGDDPLNDYNAVHTRAGLTAASDINVDDILYERRLELAMEGFKIWDVKRLHGTVATMNYNDPKLIYPIPQGDLDVNPNLVQNPGY